MQMVCPVQLQCSFANFLLSIIDSIVNHGSQHCKCENTQLVQLLKPFYNSMQIHVDSKQQTQSSTMISNDNSYLIDKLNLADSSNRKLQLPLLPIRITDHRLLIRIFSTKRLSPFIDIISVEFGNSTAAHLIITWLYEWPIINIILIIDSEYRLSEISS